MALFAVAPLLALVIAPILARALGPGDRGLLALLLATYSFAMTLGSFGQAEALLADLRAQVFTVPTATRYTIVSLASVVMAGAGVLVATALGVDSLTSVLVFLFVPVLAWAQLWRALALSRGMTLVLSAQGASTAMFRAGVIISLFVLGRTSLLSVAMATQAALLVGALLLRLALLRAGNRPSTRMSEPTSKGPITDFAQAVRQALPVLGFATCTAVVLRSDILILGALSTSAETGYYATVLAISETALAVSAAFKNRIVACLFSPDPMWRIVREIAIMLGVFVPAVAIAEALAGDIVIAAFGADFAPAIPAFRVLLVAAILQAVFDCGQGALAALGMRSTMLASSAAGAIAAVLSAILLVPRMGALGAAVSSFISYAVVATTSWTVVAQRLRGQD